MHFELDGIRFTSDDPEAFYIAPTAVVIGKVHLKRNASIWWNAVLRGDNDTLTIGENTNVQDNSVLHTDDDFPLVIGNNCTIGHMAMLHGCTVGDGSMIGIGATVLNGAKIGKNCIIGANSLITDNKVIPDNSVVMGSPGKIVRETTAADTAMIQETVQNYLSKQPRYKNTLKQLG